MGGARALKRLALDMTVAWGSFRVYSEPVHTEQIWSEVLMSAFWAVFAAV